MLGFPETFLAWVGATLLPALAGLAIVVGAGHFAKGRYLAAFGFGIFLWFFVDTIGGAADMDVNAGFGGGVQQVAIVVLFALGLVFLFAMDRTAFLPDSETAAAGLTIPLLVAVALSIHGFGEGTSFGNTAATTASSSLLDAFGGLAAGAAYVLHKALEPMMIGACYVVYAKGRECTAVSVLKDVLLLGLVFTIPSIVGAVTGYFISYDSTYFFALGTGTSVYAALRLAKPLYLGDSTSSPNESLNTAIWLLFGFLCIYSAALLHS